MPGITKIGKYLVRRELGKGAMGVVYEGFDPVIERTVAIKTILPQQLGGAQAADVLARFKREAQAAGRLNHPGIVAVYDYGEVVAEDDHTLVVSSGSSVDEGPKVAFIAMEFVKGRELRDFFEADERFPLREVQRLMTEILTALAHAHLHGVVHRDMKPANLIVLENGSVKIADFGIARVEKSELTQAGTIMGTPAYMSPEQFMGQTVDGRSDIFSCGVILYQFLTGEKPFTGNTTTIMYKVLREEPLAPSLLNVALPAGLDAVVKTAMAKNPDDRYQSAAAFVEAIEQAVATPVPVQDVRAMEQTVVSTVVSTAARAAADPGSAPHVHADALGVAPPAIQPRRTLAMVLVGIAALVAVAAAGYLLAPGGRDIGASAVAPSEPATTKTAIPSAVAQAPAPAGPAVVAAPDAASADPVLEPGNTIVSALGLVNPTDPRFNGDVGAAQAEARADAKRQLVEKVLALYVDGGSLNKNYAVIQEKLLSQSGSFIKTVLQEGAPRTGKDGLLESETRAVVMVRAVQKSLNQLSKEERIDFIRNNGDPKVAIQMTVANADAAQSLPAARSQLAENVVKERIKSFGFRVWSNEDDGKTHPDARKADFLIQGEAKVKQLSAKLAASGLTITKTVLTSWTVSAIDKSTGEEIYLNTVMPQGKSWPSEDQALGDIGRLMGDEFSKSFFLQHFSFGVRRTVLNVSGVPDASVAHLLLRELRGVRRVVDAQMVDPGGRYLLQLPEGSAADLVQDAVIRPLNAKLGQNCLALGSSNDREVNVSFSSVCADAATRARLESMPPAGLLNAPDARGKPLLKDSPVKTMVMATMTPRFTQAS